MRESTQKEIKAFIGDLHHAAELLESAAQGKRGWKTAAQRARVLLSAIKKQIAPLRKLTIEESKL